MDIYEAMRLLKGGRSGINEWNDRRRKGEEIPDLNNAYLLGVNLEGALLTNVSLNRANLDGVNLDSSDLRHAYLHEANLRRSSLRKADLRDTDLSEVDFHRADLRDADLRRANLWGTYFNRSDLARADFRESICAFTTFAAVDLSEVIGLDSVSPRLPCEIGEQTLFSSKGKIPDSFLRGCGVPEVLITFMESLRNSVSPIRFYTCFISYSTKDEEFATRLHNDFQAAGIRCWKWDTDARIGKPLWSEIDQAIRMYDKLVLIASRNSLISPQVNREIERAIVQEEERKVLKDKGRFDGDIDVLFPVALDDYLFKKWEHERKVDVLKKMVAKAKGWSKNTDIYTNICIRLIDNLKSERLT